MVRDPVHDDHSLSIQHQQGGLWLARFTAMASPCEVFIESVALDQTAARDALRAAAGEAWRIEQKFSRYRPDNIVARINRAAGATVTVDDETSGLLDFAEQCWYLSDGLFDITSGPLRKLWRFDGGAVAAIDAARLRELLVCVGWQKCQWQKPALTLPAGAEIDFGGVGKEYAVDKTLKLLRERLPKAAMLVNFGGDLACGGERLGNKPWVVGMESVSVHSPLTRDREPIYLFDGAIATSGDSHRYLYFQGRKQSHLLNPKTGYPVADAPQSITVAAANCTLAGMLSSLAMLRGEGAEAFLEEQQVRYWLQRQPGPKAEP